MRGWCFLICVEMFHLCRNISFFFLCRIIFGWIVYHWIGWVWRKSPVCSQCLFRSSMLCFVTIFKRPCCNIIIETLRCSLFEQIAKNVSWGRTSWHYITEWNVWYLKPTTSQKHCRLAGGRTPHLEHVYNAAQRNGKASCFLPTPALKHSSTNETGLVCKVFLIMCQ